MWSGGGGGALAPFLFSIRAAGSVCCAASRLQGKAGA
uniref:Uncharacterized protein n=1 Tax=Arundo donax TaxID=35708 RepID=A0A0A9FX16_ARUDO